MHLSDSAVPKALCIIEKSLISYELKSELIN